MSADSISDPYPEPRGLLEYTHWIYALHALAVLIGLLTARAVAPRFAFGLPSIVAVVMNYARRAEARGTWLESHFIWQIRTFWFAWLWIAVVLVISLPLTLVLVGFGLMTMGFAAIGVWIIYRVLRGWLALRDRRTLPVAI